MRSREEMLRREAQRAYQRDREAKMFEALDWFARQYKELGRGNTN